MMKHVSTSISGLIDYGKTNSLSGILSDNEGRRYPHEEAIVILYEKLAAGERWLPTDDCEGFDPVTGCPGHPKQEKVNNSRSSISKM